MEEEQFYVTLPSDSSLHIYPDNKLSDYRVRLDPPLALNPDEWQVGLASISIPVSWENVGKVSDNSITIYHCHPEIVGGVVKTLSILDGGEMAHWWGRSPSTSLRILPQDDKDIRVFTLEQGLYRHTHDIVSFLNDAIAQYFRNQVKHISPWFQYNKHTRRLQVRPPFDVSPAVEELQHLSNYAFVLQGKDLLSILGYPGQDSVYFYLFEMMNGRVIEAPMTVNPQAGFSTLYVYCDAIQAQRVGDVFASLLDYIPVVDNDKDVINFRANPIHYSAVAQGRLSSLRIYIASETGERVPFAFGKIVLKLHFRRRPLALQ